MGTDNYQFFRSSQSAFSVASLTLLAAAVFVPFFALLQAQSVPETTIVRVINDSGLPLKNIRLNDVLFGDLSVGGISQYQPLATAYPYASLRLEVGKETFEWMPTDHYGEKPLGKGNFIYSIRRENTVVGPKFVAQIRESSIK
jgi:hypothetical protein